MKLLQHLIFTLFSCALLTSCQKEGSLEPGTTPSANGNRLKTYKEVLEGPFVGYTAVYDVNYDNNGRLSSMVNSAAPGDKFVFTYPSTNSRILEMFSDGTADLHVEWYLNASQLVDSLFQYNDEDSSTTKVVYNSNKQVIAIKDYEYSKRSGARLTNTTAHTYNAEGDMVRSIDTEGVEVLNEYYTDAKYELPTSWELPLVNNTGKVHLLKKETVVSGGSVVEVTNHTYTFDAQRRVVSDKAITQSGPVITKTYTYL